MVLSRPRRGGGPSHGRPLPRRRSGLRSALTAGALVATVLAGPAATGPSASAASYDLKHGETLSGVAGRLGVSVAALADANAIVDLTRVPAGTRLVLP